MTQTCLIVVDVQNDFVSGSLGSAEARAMLPRLLDRVQRHEGPLLFTRDTHYNDYLATREGRLLPVVHCVESTWGWQIVPELDALRRERGARVFDKETFGSTGLGAALADMAGRGEMDAVEFTGLCTDICVVSNALLARSFAPQLEVRVDAACCAGTSPAAHIAALDVMASCQVIVMNGPQQKRHKDGGDHESV